MSERLQKVLAQWGIASRRQAESLILVGRIRVNGQVIKILGTKVDPRSDQVMLDDRILNPPDQAGSLKTLLLHKPLGVLSTCADPQGRPTVLDLIPADWRAATRFYPVGRLDADSTGALLLTNDGDLTLRLTHPRYHLPKTYRVEVQGIPSAATLQRWREGVLLEGQRTLPAQVECYPQSKASSQLKIILQEGRNRQIRRIAELLGHPVVRLHREAIGSLGLGDLGLGECRLVHPTELQALAPASQLSPVPGSPSPDVSP